MFHLSKDTRTVIVSILILLLLPVLMLSGCATDSSREAGPAAPVVASASSSEPSSFYQKPQGDIYKIKWYTIGTPQRDIPAVMVELSKYTLPRINATVEMIQYDWGEYDEKMELIIQSGEPFDICYSSSGANDFIRNGTKGAFLPLDALLGQYGRGILEQEHPLFLEAAKINGKTYGIPVNKELNCVTVWAFNKRVLDKYGLDISSVKGIETLEPLLRKVKEGEGNSMPDVFAVNANSGIPEAGIIDYPIGEDKCIGMRMDSGERRFINKYEDLEVIHTLKYMRKYYLAGYIRQDAAMNAGGDYQTTGNYLVKQDGWIPGADELWSRNAGYPIVSVPVYDSFFISSAGLLGSCMAISATSGDPASAMKFLNLLNTDRYVRNTADSGIEGVHYRMEDGRQINLPASRNYDMPTFTLGNRYILNSYIDDPYDDMGAQYKRLNDSGVPSPLIGFRPDTSRFTSELAAIVNVSKEFTPGLITGSVDPDIYLSKFIAKLKSVGFDRVLEDVQRQYDEFLAGKE